MSFYLIIEIFLHSKTWERDRRIRMNEYFKMLADLLPSHQEGRKLIKVDILIHAINHIKDLQGRMEGSYPTYAIEAHSM